MSRVNYQFATISSTGWCHRVRCDLCQFTVTRIGEMPKSESDAVPTFEPGTLVGWAQFSMQAPRPVDTPDADEDTWPRLDRDLCSSCARVTHDLLCEMGCAVGTVEVRKLDALGRPFVAPRFSDEVGVLLCGQRIGQVQWECRLRFEHTEECSPLLPAELQSLLECSVCPQEQYGDPVYTRGNCRLYTQQQLESHAVEMHSVRFGSPPDASTIGSGWYFTGESPRVLYSDVTAALLAARADR